MRFLQKDCFAVSVDFQEKLVPAMRDADSLLANATKLLKGLKILGVETIVSRQYPNGLGDTVQELRNIGDFRVFDKLTFSCFDNEDFKNFVLQKQERTAIIFGIESHVCVMQTIIDMQNAGFHCVYVADCSMSRQKSDEFFAMERMRNLGVSILSLEALLFELTRTAANPVFKEISALIK